MIHHLVFDLGNVLVDIHPRNAMNRLAQECDKELSQIEDLFLSSTHLEFMAGKLNSEQFFQKIKQMLHCQISYDQFVATWRTIIGNPKIGVADLIDRLSPELTLSVCSNTDPLHWEIAGRILPFVDRFQYTFLSYEMGYTKPDPTVFQKMLSTLGSDAGSCILIDDTLENIKTARDFGLNVVHASTAGKISKSLAKFNVFSS